jgi:hypothetical protein
VLERLGLSEDALRREHWRLTDPFLLDLVGRAAEGDSKRPKLHLSAYRWSPLVADPLGLLAMEMGQTNRLGPILLTRDTAGGNLPSWSPTDGELILKRSAEPYLRELEAACREALAREKLVVLVTARSFSSRPLADDRDRRRPRPQVALGSDDERTPEGLTTLAGTIFRSLGWWPQLNWPLAGAPVPPSLSDAPRLKALGLYLRRDLYMDERTGRGLESSDGAVRVLRTFFNLLTQELDRVARLKLDRAFPPKPPSNVIKANAAGKEAKPRDAARRP